MNHRNRRRRWFQFMAEIQNDREQRKQRRAKLLSAAPALLSATAEAAVSANERKSSIVLGIDRVLRATRLPIIQTGEARRKVTRSGRFIR
jgi:hypothetical protein